MAKDIGQIKPRKYPNKPKADPSPQLVEAMTVRYVGDNPVGTTGIGHRRKVEALRVEEMAQKAETERRKQLSESAIAAKAKPKNTKDEQTTGEQDDETADLLHLREDERTVEKQRTAGRRKV